MRETACYTSLTPSPRPTESPPYRVLTLSATTSGHFDAKYFKFFAGPVPDDSPLWLHPNDILIQRGNTIEYVGVSAIYDGPARAFTYPDLMMKVRPNQKVQAKYLHYFLSWDRSRNYLRERATGTAGNMPKINQGTLMGLPIDVPHPDEQHEIILRVDALLGASDSATNNLVAASRLSETLSCAVLASPFCGRLVSQFKGAEEALHA